MKYGFIFRWKSAWIGLHYSDYNKRFCLNVIPFFTIWWLRSGGTAPGMMPVKKHFCNSCNQNVERGDCEYEKCPYYEEKTLP